MTRVSDLVGLAIGGHESDAEELRVGLGKLRNVGGYWALEGGCDVSCNCLRHDRIGENF